MNPKALHRIKHNRSILTLVVFDQFIFAGTQGGEILKWSLETYELIGRVNGHVGSLLCLFLSGDGSLLFSSAGDGIVNVWCTSTLNRLYSIYSTYDVGDVFCVTYSTTLQTAYLGAQNTSIQWYDLKEKDQRAPPKFTSHPSHRNHRFFDSKGPDGLSAPRPLSSPRALSLKEGGQILEIDKEHIVQYAHYGYVYCMLLTRGLCGDDAEDEVLISGGGDGTIKLWHLGARTPGAISEKAVLESGDNSVLSMALDGTFLYSGHLGGEVNVWDLDTKQRVRSAKLHTHDVLTISVGSLAGDEALIFSAAASGVVRVFNRRNQCVSQWQAHEGLVLASATTIYHQRRIYVSGGNDDCLTLWDISNYSPQLAGNSPMSNDHLLESLEKFIAFRTVSSDPELAEDCRRGATYLRTLFKRYGATTHILTTANGLNPIILAKFCSNVAAATPRKRILFYGHYDVISADNTDGKWLTDPFTLAGISGYLYGRGVTDNKGPILAAMYAAAELAAEQSLGSDVIFLIEGEEECGSRGFKEAVEKNKDVIGNIDWIMLANSYWLDDETPCLTYGLRGIVRATITVKSDHPDLHSGVDGGIHMDEPLKDLISLLAKLTGPNGRIQISNFYDAILPATAAEEERYDDITRLLLSQNPGLRNVEDFKLALKGKWREPSLTIHKFNVSGPENSTVIPSAAQATLSIRIVPNQEALHVQEMLVQFLESSFAQLGTRNHINVRLDHQADPWLGDPGNSLYQTLEEAVIQVWAKWCEQDNVSNMPASSPFEQAVSNGLSRSGSSSLSPTSTRTEVHSPSQASRLKPNQKPLYIREGGSIPAIRFLEKTFEAPAAQLPCGQASDHAHLDNERIRLANLYNSREIFKRVFGGATR